MLKPLGIFTCTSHDSKTSSILAFSCYLFHTWINCPCKEWKALDQKYFTLYSFFMVAFQICLWPKVIKTMLQKSDLDHFPI